MKHITLAALLFLVSCNEPRKAPEFTALQKEYLSSLPLEGKVYMEQCLKSWGINTCIHDYNHMYKYRYVLPNNN